MAKLGIQKIPKRLSPSISKLLSKDIPMPKTSWEIATMMEKAYKWT